MPSPKKTWQLKAYWVSLVQVLYAMLGIRCLVEGLGVFERNRVSLELKVLGLAFYIQLQSLRRASKALSEVHRVSKTAFQKRVRKLGEKLNNPSKIPRMHIALDETCVEVNGLKYWVYAALDVDRNKIISMMVFQELAGYQALHRGGLEVLCW